MSDQNLRKCLQALRSAQSDNERFAALMMVTKVVRAEECDDDTRREILEAMGFRFLTRLMKTTSVPEGCPTSIYKSIALSILSSFTQDPAVVANPEIKKQVTVLNEVILGNFSNEDGDTSSENMLSDCYDCLRGLLLSPTSRRYLLDGGAQRALVEVIVSKKTGSEKACEVLLELLRREKSRVWEIQPSDAHKLLRCLVTDFKVKQDATKFDVGEILTVVLSTVEKKDEDQEQAWVKDLVKELNGIIRSKLDDKLRDSTLCLVSSLVSSQGVTCVLPPYTEDLKLLLLVTHLACIEVRMILEDGRLEQIHKKSGVVCSCYGLLENLIGHMTTGTSMGLNEKQIVQLHSAMMGAFNSVIFFLSQVEQQQIEMPTTSLLVTASVRVLGAWLAEETSALRDEIYTLLPFLIQMCKQQNNHNYEELPDLGPLSLGDQEKMSNPDGQADGQEDKMDTNNSLVEGQASNGHGDSTTVPPSTDCDKPISVTPPADGGKGCHGDDIKDGPSTDVKSKAVGDNKNSEASVNEGEGDGLSSSKQEPSTECNSSETKCDKEGESRTDKNSPTSNSSQSKKGKKKKKRQEANSKLPVTDNGGHEDGAKDNSNDQKSVICDGSSSDASKKVDKDTPESSDTKMKKAVHFDEASDNLPPKDVTNGVESKTDGVDLVKFLLPAMCHLTAEKKPREILLQENVHALLVDYFQKQMVYYLDHRDDSDLRDTLASLCGIFLNLSVTEPAFVSAHHKFHQLLSSLLTYLPATVQDTNLLILTGNFVTLGLMMLRHQSDRTDITSENRDQFLAGSISFLSKAHSRVKRKPPMLAVSESYKAAWDDISELWFLSMQGLSALVPVIPDLSKLIMKSGWVPAIIRIFLEVQGAGVDADSQSALLSLLTTLALNDTSAKRVIKEKRGIELAQMYLCEDLQNALTTS